LVQVDNGDLDMRAFQGNNGARRTTWRYSSWSADFVAFIEWSAPLRISGELGLVIDDGYRLA